MQIDKKAIEKNLPKKGFVKKESHHTYFHHTFNNRETGVYTYTSHGAAPKTYDDKLIGKMKKQLELDTNSQVADLCNCPMSGDEYNKILRRKGLL